MVDILGFNIDPKSEGQVSADDFSEITEWVAGVKFAGEFYDATADEIKDVVKLYPIDYVEVEDLDVVEKIGLLGKPLIVRIQLDNEAELGRLKSSLSYLDELAHMVIIRSNNADLFDSIDAQIGYYNGNLKLLKGYGITEDSSMCKYPGLALEATEEERPGY